MVMEKSRRQVLLGTGALIGSASLSGCSDIITTGGLAISDYQYQTTPTNNVEFTVIVENFDPFNSASGTLTCQISTSSNTFSSEEEISVPSGEENTYVLTVSPNLELRLSGGEYNTDVFLE